MGAWFLAPDTSIHCVNNGLPDTALARTASGREVEDCCLAHQLFVGVHKLALQIESESSSRGYHPDPSFLSTTVVISKFVKLSLMDTHGVRILSELQTLM